MHVDSVGLAALVAVMTVASSCFLETKDTQQHSGTSQEDSWENVVDNDYDGITVADGDCDDGDPDIHPGVFEECNGVDDNCNGLIDEGLADSDLDGTADCMDLEDCDGADNDGDGLVDEDFGDQNGDGIADCLGSEVCDGIDNDGDGEMDEGFDADGDGFTECGSAVAPADCDDSDVSIGPGVAEIPDDRIDNNCDGLIDEGAWTESDLVITEVMANPSLVSDLDGEWFEIYNNSGRTVYLNGLVFGSSVDGDYHQVAGDLPIVLRPESFFVLGRSSDTSINGGVAVDYVFDGIILSNESDELYIMAGDVLVDVITWDDGVTMPDPNGASMSLDTGIVGLLQNDNPLAWCPATIPWGEFTDLGSPGVANEACTNWDHDGDGLTRDQGDCDDNDITVYPGAPEIDSTIDHDCDGRLNTMPSAVASYDAKLSPLFICTTLYLVGSASSDPEGSALTYAWTLDAAPPKSLRTTADLHTATSMNPTFDADVDGRYVFGLVVSDGDDVSVASTVMVNIQSRGYNSDPVASVGPDINQYANSTCTSSSYGTVWTCPNCSDYYPVLDTSGTLDPDGDALTWAWSVLSGGCTVASPSTAAPGLVMAGPSTSRTVTTTLACEIQLTVSDCMGGMSTDSVVISYGCTGI